ncbi:MAG: hypothetical protein IPM23_10780 [Candidatus Melainabacteria bacterium]|nr:hypothetical protein [Candidatus Melainabacteria bacterium]
MVSGTTPLPAAGDPRLDYAVTNNRSRYRANSWTDPEVKASLGAAFTGTRHLVYIRNPLLRAVLSRLKHLFEPDAGWHHQ